MTTRSVQAGLKGLVEPSLGRLAWKTRSAAHRSGCVVLAYHNVLPPGAAPAGERALHIPWNRFMGHLDFIQGVAQVVNIREALSPFSAEHPLRVILTFDDAYSAAVGLALPEIARRGLSATMFVAPGLLEGRSFWWDQLADPQRGELPAHLRSHALSMMRGTQDEVQAWAHDRDLPWTDAMPPWATGASLAAVRHAASLPGITMGAHSWSHPSLTALDEASLHEEMQRPRHWLQEHGLGNAEWLAYPYGLASATTGVAADTAGYSGALLVSGGFIGEEHSRFHLPRINIPSGLTPAGLRLRLSGWLAR